MTHGEELKSGLKLGGVIIDLYSFEESLEKVWEASQKNPVTVFWANAHAINTSQNNREYKEALLQADFLLNDGAGIQFAARALGQPVRGNLNGTDWIPAFFDRVQEKGCTVYFLGAKAQVVEQAAARFKTRWPRLKMAGCHHGYFPSVEPILAEIENKRPSIIVVGMGVPLQELFIARHWKRLKASGVRAAIAGGAIFDFISGAIPRAPSWIRNAKLEWLFRLLLEPRRLAKRYLVGNGLFIILVCREWLAKKRHLLEK